MDPKIAKHVNDIIESMMEFFEAWSAIDEQIANSLKALEKLEEEEEMETMGYVDCNPLDIPLYGFEFVPFGDILAKKGSDVYLIDIIGQVTAYGELTKTAKSRCMTIELMDTKNDNLTCVLWGTYADEMINYINAEGANGAIIVILQFAKRIMYKGGVRVQNSRYASRLFINTQLSEIIAFKDSMCCKTQQISGQLTQLTNDSDDFLKQEYVKDIFDIMNMKKSCVCVCLATIEDIDVGYSWYYDGCNRCMSGVIREDDVIRCRKQNVVLRSTTPRFKIKLIVADKSGDASFMMFDKEVSKLVGRTAKEMVASQNQIENNEFPEEFKSLLGKRFLFKVTVPYNNGVDQNYSYTVNSTSDEPKLINKWIELYMKFENSIVVKKESEAESVQECEENRIKDTCIRSRQVLESVSKRIIPDDSDGEANDMHVDNYSNSDARVEIIDSDRVVAQLKDMIDQHNPLAKSFRMARDRFESNNGEDLKLRLIGRRDSDGRTYNLPTTSEVAALIVGDIDTADKRD
ncbi:uncharacterized protein LOC125495725 [Beta vulgaris subsp. vulgaris]|uniref:uncharacterized protein LOC125495725 n=1 Tax=Beta vulgaris subsp. vulgaris TaxID=3555 RepID=UPI0025467426|nr:uncharacterized protein LOC125495725 [Beta vulgaris subsp. vulgaris]